jgi:meso-butanediol dehydrogenase/(S,S)-butanediol dehydrogenase/diacetyl reductase
MGKLDGKVAVITGGTSGFGESTALLFAREGAKVVVSGRSGKRGETVVGRIRAEGGSAVFVEADITAAKAAGALVREAVGAYGRLDILFNNAGILGPRGVMTAEFPEEEARRLMDLNVLGVFYVTRYAIPEMINSGGGSIISNGSDSAFVGNRGLAVYCATKGAVVAFTRAVAMEYADRGIRANTVSPGAGRTPMHAALFDGDQAGRKAWEGVLSGIPLRRAADPEDVAQAALFFASDDSRHITGANLMVDGGWTAKGL